MPLINQNNNNWWADERTHHHHHHHHRGEHFYDSPSSSSSSSSYDWLPRRQRGHGHGQMPADMLVHQALVHRDREIWKQQTMIKDIVRNARREEEDERQYREMVVLDAKLKEEQKKREEDEKEREVIATWKRKEREREVKRERERREFEEAYEERLIIDLLMARASGERSGVEG